MHVQGVGHLVFAFGKHRQLNRLERLGFRIKTHQLAFIEGRYPQHAIRPETHAARAFGRGWNLGHLHGLLVDGAELPAQQFGVPDGIIYRADIDAIWPVVDFRPSVQPFMV